MIKISTLKRLPILAIVIASFILYPVSGKARAKSPGLVSKMEKIATRFAQVYTSRPDAAVPVTLAVFPFQTTEKLVKKRVNFAVGEIFTHNLIETGTFKIVERVELEKIFKEQELSLTGAIESETAIKVGKLLGARLLVLGSINRLGKFYQVSARLVDAQTSEILASEFIEVDIKVFEEEAAAYLVLVPEKQAIGLYLLGGSTRIISQSLSLLTFAGTRENINYSVNISPKVIETGVSSYALGGRYFPLRWLMLDVAYIPQSFFSTGNNCIGITKSEGTSPEGQRFGQHNINMTLKSSGFRGVVNSVINLSRSFKGYLGLGMDAYIIEYNVTAGATQQFDRDYKNWVMISERILTPTGGHPDIDPWNLDRETISFKDNHLLTFIRLGLEYRPQSRIGFCLFGNYTIVGEEIDPLGMHIFGNVSSENFSEEISFPVSEMDILKLQNPSFSIEATFSLYF